MATIFSKIIAGEIPSYKVAEDEKFYAFLDINPLVKGHTLVVPKREVDYIFDLEDSELAEMHVLPRRWRWQYRRHSRARRLERQLSVWKCHMHIFTLFLYKRNLICFLKS